MAGLLIGAVANKKNAEADGFRFGDEFFTDLSFQYRVWPRQLGAGVPVFLFAVVETNLISQGRHRIAGTRDPDSEALVGTSISDSSTSRPTSLSKVSCRFPRSTSHTAPASGTIFDSRQEYAGTCRSRSEQHGEKGVMRINAHRGRQRLRTPFSRTLVFMAVALLAGTLTMAAQAPAGGQKQAVVTVQGMQCPFCAYGIKKHLAKLPGVTRVDVELAKNQATVTFVPDAKVTDAQIQQAIRKAGFTPDKIAWQSVGQREKTTAPHTTEEEMTASGAMRR